MLHEFVFIAKAVFVQYTVIIEHNRVIHVAAQREIAGPQALRVKRMKPKVRARLTSRKNDVVEKSIEATWEWLLEGAG